MEKCTMPDFCPIGNVNNELSKLEKRVEKIDSKQDKLIEVVADIRFLREAIQEIKTVDHCEHDEIFKRLRIVENEKISRRDVGLIVAILTVILGFMNFIFIKIGIR